MNAEFARFWNQDVYEGKRSDPVTFHKYLYGNANPILFYDPSGRFSLTEIQATLGVVAKNALLATPRVVRTANKIFEQLFPASMLFNLSAAVADDPTGVAALLAASYQFTLIKKFKSTNKRKPFAIKRLARLARLVANAAASSITPVPRKVNGFPDFSGATHLTKGTVFIGKLTGSRGGDQRKADRKRGMVKPIGYTWHHHEVVGLMQLVRSDIHGPVRHIGGVFYWEVAMNKQYR